MIYLLPVSVSANVLGDMQTFAPNTDGRDFITVHTGRPLDKGWWAFSNYANYARNHLLVYSDLAAQTPIRPFNDQLLEYDLDIAYGLTDRLQLFFASPILMWQESDPEQTTYVNVTRGPATYRPGFKWTLTDDDRTNSAIVISADILSVRNSPYTGLDPTPIFNFEWAQSWITGQNRKWALNIGYRQRNPGPIPLDARMLPLDDQIMASFGYSATFSKTSRWVFEVFASAPAQRGLYNDQEDASSLDLLLGLKHRWYKNLNFDWGATIEPPGLETLSPRVRAFIGVVYYWTSQDKPKTTPTAITRNEEPLEAEAVDPLQVHPALAEVFEGTRVPLRGEGGITPYRFEVVEGAGSVDALSGVVRTRSPGRMRVRLSDARPGMYVDAVIIVKKIPKADLEISLKNLEFKFDTDILTEKSTAIMDKQLVTMRKMSIQRLIIEGHTDSKGSDEYNEDLSERRAQAIKRILMQELGLTDDQVTAIGRGETQPIATNVTDEGRQNNRRVDLKVYWRKK